MVRSAGTAPACRICSSCTVHSMSARPPRPSLRWVAGSAPRGSRSLVDAGLDPAYLDARRPRRCPSAGKRSGSISSVNRRRSVLVADHGVGAQQRLRLPDLRPLGVVGGVGRRGCAPAAPACPRGAGRRRPRAPGRAPGSDEQPAQLVGHAPGRTTRRPAGPRRARGLVHEHHVGVAAVGQLEAAVAAHRHDRHPRRRRVERRCCDAHRPAGDLERRLQGRVGEPGQRGADLGDVDQRRAGRPTAIRNSSRRRIAADRAHRLDRVVLAPAAATHLRRSAPRRAQRREVRRPEHPHALAARARAGRWRSGEVASTRASRSATWPSSRSVWRYQWRRARAPR